ncbi:MAG TPA: hypothetical protein VD928_02825 [Candidatus Paceibacterota bacterium]|nr:hypothetical protein [Candidatus Paceibacterota bacterium]
MSLQVVTFTSKQIGSFDLELSPEVSAMIDAFEPGVQKQFRDAIEGHIQLFLLILYKAVLAGDIAVDQLKEIERSNRILHRVLEMQRHSRSRKQGFVPPPRR